MYVFVVVLVVLVVLVVVVVVVVAVAVVVGFRLGNRRICWWFCRATDAFNSIQDSSVGL